MGKYKANWRYYLADGTNSVRQMTDAQGQVRGTRRFTPWGEILEQSGQGDITSGYLGGMLDAATGLIYIGNGQYYDPATGRFLTRDANPSQTNPYVPWRSDPAGAMLAPLALLAVVYGRKKKLGKWEKLVIEVVLCLTAGIILTACAMPTTVTVNPPPSGAPTSTPKMTATITSTTVTIAVIIPSSTGPPSPTPTLTCPFTVTRTPTQTPDQLNETLLRDKLEKNTNKHGKDYYAWYKQLWQNKNWWWWNNHTTFSVWDLFSLVIHIE